MTNLSSPSEELIKKLKAGNIDIIIGKIPKTLDYDLKYEKIGQTKYIFVASNKTYNFNNKELSINEINKYPILLQKSPSNSRESAEKYFKDNNINIQPKMSIAGSNLLIDFIRMGYGIGYVTKLYVEDELKTNNLIQIKVFPKPDKIQFGIITLKNNIMTSNCNNFIKHIKHN